MYLKQRLVNSTLSRSAIHGTGMRTGNGSEEEIYNTRTLSSWWKLCAADFWVFQDHPLKGLTNYI